ncbi:MAG: hypothetical protein AAGA77_20300, partial [Bacteroidota bacterium]
PRDFPEVEYATAISGPYGNKLFSVKNELGEKLNFLEKLQFGFPKKYEDFKTTREVLFSDNSFDSWYFIPDMFLLISLFAIVFILIKKLRDEEDMNSKYYPCFRNWMLGTGIIAVLSDIYENSTYLGWITGKSFYLPFVEDLKIASIALFFGIFILFLLVHSIQKENSQEKSAKSKSIYSIIKASSISIVMLIVLAIGLTLLDQGATLVVHLYDEVEGSKVTGIIQICATVFLINLLAIMLSHYPEYIQSIMEKDNKTRWYINWWFKLFSKSNNEQKGVFPGLITFTNKHYNDLTKPTDSKEDILENVDSYQKNDDSTTVAAAQVEDNLKTGTSAELDAPKRDSSAQEADKQVNANNKGRFEKLDTLFRYLLGVMTYVAWFYVIYEAFDLYGLTDFNAPASVFLWTFLVCTIIYYLFRIHRKDSEKLRDEIEVLKKTPPDNNVTITISKEAIDQVKPWTRGYIALFYMTIFLGFCAWYVFNSFGWHKWSFLVSIAFLLTNTFLYVFFRFTRFYLKYVWFDSKRVKYLLEKDQEAAFKSSQNSVQLVLENGTKTNWTHKILGFTSSSYNFLKSISFSTLAAAAYLIWTFTTMDSYITEFSTIPMLLALLAVLNILIIYPVKLFLANARRRNIGVDENLLNAQPDAENLGKEPMDAYRKRKSKFYIYAFAFIVLLIGINIASNYKNIHKLYFNKATSYMTVDTFSNRLLDHITRNIIHDSCGTVKPMLQVASFGGGLKSNLWTLLVMDALDDSLSVKLSKLNSPTPHKARILDHTISLSGVSGGAVGLGNYMVLDHMNRVLPDYDRDSIIRKIGEENILAIDAAGIFGHDKIMGILKLLPGSSEFNRDRSYYAMDRYMKILTRTNKNKASEDEEEAYNILNSSSLAEYWNSMLTGVNHNPALIINTASTGSKPGVSFSLASDSITFPGYIHLSDTLPENQGYEDLKYFDAVSTSNRFPIMSPTAQVEEKGHFLDGGYFENSGLLTLNQFLAELKRKLRRRIGSSIDNYPIGTVSIINSKSDYVRKFIKNHEIKKVEINGSTNAAAIIAGITNIDKLPNVLLSTAKTYTTKEDYLFTIYMPHPITIDDIQNVIGGKVAINKDLIEDIRANNEMIKDVVDTFYSDQGLKMDGLVVPPLARTLSKPAVDYEIAMIKHHDSVRVVIDSILTYITKCPKQTKEQNKTATPTEVTSDQNRTTRQRKPEPPAKLNLKKIQTLPEKTKIKRSRKKGYE